jgi:hypothetical protein
VLSFARVSVRELRDRWLRNHEEVRRSSVHTVRRYRAASEHLLRFVEATAVALDVSRFSLGRAEEYITHHYLERPHQGLGNIVPAGECRDAPAAGTVECRERLGGLLRSYSRAAA